jgi:hypothetical protein
VVFCLFAAGAFFGEADEGLFLDPDAGRLLVPEETLLGPDVDAAAEVLLEVLVVLFLGEAVDFLVAFLVDFLVDFFLVDFFAAFLTGTFFGDDCNLARDFNSFLPASVILYEALTLVNTWVSTPFLRARLRSLRTRGEAASL